MTHHCTLPFDEYRAAPGINSSGLRDLLINPAYYQYRQRNPLQQSDSMRWGSLVDLAITEPEQFRSLVRVLPSDAPKRPSITQRNAKKPSDETVSAIEWWDAWERQTAGCEIVTADELETIQTVADGVRSHACMKPILAHEKTLMQPCLFWKDEETGIACKARLDIWHGGNVVVDLKKTASVSTVEFQRSVRKFGYDVQAAFYYDGCRAVFGEEPAGFAWMVYEIEPPFQRRFFVAHPDWLQRGREKYRRALAVYAECVANGEWPGYPEIPETLDAPVWG